MTQFDEQPSPTQQNQGNQDQLQRRYRAIGIQAVAAAKAVKGAPIARQDDNTARRLQDSATD